MNWNFFRTAKSFRRKGALQGRALTTRDAQPQGEWTGVMSDWVARTVAPRFYEALREAVPVIDAAINRLVTLDGIVRVEGNNDRLVNTIDDWMQNVQVGDMQTGFQAFYAGMSNELYEQGFAVGEPTLDDTMQAVVRLDVADSKGVYFKRDASAMQVYYRKPAPVIKRSDGTSNIEAVLRNSYTGDVGAFLQRYDYQLIDPQLLVYAGLNNEAGNPYGVSLLRSMEFVSKVLLTIDNATLQTWQRFGSPSFDVQYNTKSRISDDELARRRKTLADNLKQAMETKLAGNTTDMVTALGANDSISIKVLGGDNQILDIEQPAKHVLEQIVAKTGLPPWILGYVWGTAERLALKQAELLMQESKTRFALRKPGLEKLVATHLRAQGITWRRDDWQLTQELPNMQDMLAIAQADFLRAQTELMLGNSGTVDPVTGTRTRSSHTAGATQKSADGNDDGEPWAEDDADLPRIESHAVSATVSAWQALLGKTLRVLGIDAGAGKAHKNQHKLFAFDAATMLAPLLAMEQTFVAAVGAEDGALAAQVYRAWVRGTANASAELGAMAEALTEAVRAQNRRAVNELTLQRVTRVAVRALREDIVAKLQTGVYDGMNPEVVASQLRQRFDVHDYDWRRLARSEITDAHGRGKMAQYRASSIEQYHYTTAGDSRVSAICRALSAGGPYFVGAGPLPMRSSHPNCRCTVTAVMPE